MSNISLKTDAQFLEPICDTLQMRATNIITLFCSHQACIGLLKMTSACNFISTGILFFLNNLNCSKYHSFKRKQIHYWKKITCFIFQPITHKCTKQFKNCHNELTSKKKKFKMKPFPMEGRKLIFKFLLSVHRIIK